MAMAVGTLTTELQTAFGGEFYTEVDAANAWALAYANYATAAQAASPILAAGVALGQAAMAANMTGLSTAGNAQNAIATGIRQFWVAVAAGLATSFATATAITPPPFTGLEAALLSDFAANNAPGVTRNAAASALATSIHGLVGGGTVTTPGPVVTPIV